MQTLNRPVIAYLFTTLSILIFAIDKFFQWRTVQERSKKYLIPHGPILGVILLLGGSLISYIELEISKQRTEWLPALWALLGLSILLSLSIEADAAWRMCRGLAQINPLQQLIHRFLFSLITVVLVLDSAAFVFISLTFQTHIARVFIALCNATAYGSCACFAVFFLIQQSQKETVLQKLLDTIPTKRTWGVLFCSAISSRRRPHH